jgi:hypothetical protein
MGVLPDGRLARAELLADGRVDAGVGYADPQQREGSRGGGKGQDRDAEQSPDQEPC